MIKEGDKAPAIRVENDTGEMFDLESVHGKKVVLYFFPRASTPG